MAKRLWRSWQLLVVLLIFGTALATPIAQAQTQSDWRKKLGAFRIGIVGGARPVLESRRVQPFRKALQKALGIPVEVFAARDHNALVDAMVGSRVEYAIFSATAFAAVWKLCKCAEPIAVPVAIDGSSSFHSVLIGKNGGPASLAAARGKPVIVPGKHSFSGYIYPKSELAVRGIFLDGPDWPVNDMKTMNSAIETFLSQKGAALFGWLPNLPNENAKGKAGTLRELYRTTRGKKAKFKVLWKSKPVPFGPHAVRKSLASETKTIIRKTLLEMRTSNPRAYDAIEPNLGGGFAEVQIEAYQPLVKMIDRLAKSDGTIKATSE